MKHDLDLIAIISLILAVAAMIVAIWHVVSIHQTANRLVDVQRSLSTRYIGPFPEFFPEIVALVKSAKHEIVIFCDSPAYTCFSDHRTFLEYKHSLERKADEDDVKITFTCSGPKSRESTARKQFREWDTLKQAPAFSKRLKQFLSAHRGAPAIENLTLDQFLKLLAETEVRSLEDTFARADIHEIEAFIPLHFWLVDNMKAIFAFPEDTAEYGFSTTDQKLISALLVMRNQFHRGNEVTPVAGAQSGQGTH